MHVPLEYQSRSNGNVVIRADFNSDKSIAPYDPSQYKKINTISEIRQKGFTFSF